MTAINSAFDTETVEGNIVVIAWDNGDYIEFPTVDQILEKFTANKNKRRFFCYNLRFDVDGILKMLPYENIAELMDEKDTIYKKWKLHLLGRSNFTVSDLDKGFRSTVWDIAQFYKYLKLALAAKEYLPEGFDKQDSEIIKTFVNSKEGQNTVEYYNKHHDTINEYCINDALVTKMLADVFQEACEAENYDFSQPYSLGNMAIKWFKPRLANPDYRYGQIPRIHPTHWNKENPARRQVELIMDELSRGGWNDAFRRGRFEGAYDYDIVSAYPTIMRDIPYWSGGWRRIHDEDGIGDAEYGYVFVSISDLKEPLIPEVYFYFDETFFQGELIDRPNNSVLHCCVDKKPTATTLTIDQYRFLKPRCKLKFYEGVIMIPDHDTFPLRDPIEELIQRKFKAKEEKGKKSPEYWIAKTIMNSTSGKFKQKFHTDRTWFYYPHVYGKITWKTKEIMVDLIEANDAWDDLISVSTDGIVATRKFDHVDLSGELGSFDMDKYKEFVQIGNGIYYGESEITGDFKQRMRGFVMQETKKAKYDLSDLIRENPKERNFSFPTYRPLHLRECYMHNKVLKISDTNRFVDVVRHLDINKEIKRKWSDTFENVEDMLSGRILRSEPWELKSARVMSKGAEKRMLKKLEEDAKYKQQKLGV